MTRWLTRAIPPALVAALLLPAAFLPAAAGDDAIDAVTDVPRKGRVTLFKANAAREDGDIAGAARIIVEFLEKHPDQDHFWLRFHLGANQLELGEREAAMASFQRTAELEPRFSQGWLSLGQTAYDLGRYAVAAEAIRRGWETSEAKPPYLLYYAAASHILAGEPRRALPLLEDLVSGDRGEPELDWYRALVSAAIDVEEFDRGRRAVDGMLARFPGEADAWELAFQFAASTGDYRQAAVALTVVSYLRPLTREERLQLGNVYATIGVPAEASEWYAAALKDGGEVEEWERLASAYLAAYESEAALATIQQALDREPTVRLWSLLGDLHYMEQEYAAAYDAFGECVAMDPERGRAWLMQGYCALELGRLDAAAAHLERAAGFADHADTARELLKRVRLMQAQAATETAATSG